MQGQISPKGSNGQFSTIGSILTFCTIVPSVYIVLLGGYENG